MQTNRQEQLNTERVADHQFFQYPYRWAIVALMGVMLVINGLANNTIIPIAAKLAVVYEISDAYVSSPVLISFLVYSLMNFPANHIIDTKGLRVSFLLGSGLFTGGVFLYTMINKGFFFTLLGAILVAIGQPFIINCPAKIATYWFFDQNRPFATSLMTGLMLIGTGFGFALPTLVVSEDSSQSQARSQIFYLYAGQFLASAIAFVLIYLFMRKQPPTPPSIGAEQQKTDIKQSFKIFRKSRNLWIFFTAYIIIYGTLLSFSSTVNLQLKPYNYSDIEIALFALILILLGVIGAIVWSLYLKKTTNYKFTIRAIPTISVIVMIMICIGLNVNASVVIIFILGGAVGFSVTPIIPISYDLGCQLSFPIGQAQVTGFLNGGAMILAFLITLIVTSAVSFATPKQSMIVMIIYIVLTTIGTVFFYLVKIDLKRRQAQQQGHTLDLKKVVEQAENTQKDDTSTATKQQGAEDSKQIQMVDKNYMKFNEEQQVQI